MLTPINSTPYQVEFDRPICKVVQGDGFCGILTADGKVYTWGSNKYGQLGINKPEIHVQLRPDQPLNFKEEAHPNKRVNIIDIACCFNSMIALTDDHQVFVWGKRMGKYPTIDEMSRNYVEKVSYQYDVEVNQVNPRHVGNNLKFHKIVKVIAKNQNVGLITDKGELLLQGMNEMG